MVFVEIPAGSRNKYEYDKAAGGIVLDRRLFTSTTYPADYGFIEGAAGEDGDPLDALVLVGDPTFPGCRIRSRPVGVFYMTDEKDSDEKIICTSFHDPAWAHVRDIADLRPEFRDEIEHFFQVYKHSHDIDARNPVAYVGCSVLQLLVVACEQDKPCAITGELPSEHQSKPARPTGDQDDFVGEVVSPR